MKMQRAIDEVKKLLIVVSLFYVLPLHYHKLLVVVGSLFLLPLFHFPPEGLKGPVRLRLHKRGPVK